LSPTLVGRVAGPARLLAGLLLAAVLLVRPLAYGVGASAVVLFASFVLGYVVLPGILICRLLGLYGTDRLLLLGMGTSVGLASIAWVDVAARAARAPYLLALYPVVLLGLFLAARGRPRHAAGPVPAAAGHIGALLLVAAAAAELHPLYSPRLLDQAVPMDLLFHAGNAAELRHHWPLRDPRVAGTPLNYHFLSASLPAAASQWTGLPVADLCLVLVPGLMVALLALQVYNAARVIVGDALAGILAAALVVFHADVGAFLGLPPGAFRSYLGAGLYGSPSTLMGLIGVVSLSIPVHGWLGGADRSRRAAFVLVLLAAAVSGTKGSAMPVVLLGLAAVVAYRMLARREAKDAVALAGLLALASAPMTLWLLAGPGSYRGQIQVRPGALAHTSPFYQTVCSLITSADLSHPTAEPCALPFHLAAAVDVAWLAGYLGLGGLSALLWLARERRPIGDTPVFILGVAAAGLLLALTLGTSSGLSQLFFLYNGQVLLAILGGAALAGAFRSPGQGRWVAAALLLLAFGPPMARHGATAVAEGLARDRWMASLAPAPAVRLYNEGLGWLRRHAPADAVIVTRHGAMVVSAYAERRSFYETGFFSPRGHALRWDGHAEPYPERLAARDRLARAADPTVIAEVAAATGANDILLVQDNLHRLPGPGLVQLVVGTLRGVPPVPAAWASPAYENEAIRIYRIDRVSPPQP
jgi:hypothetical protein